MIIYNTKDGDVLDDICYRFYGHLDGTVEKVLEANDFLGFAGRTENPAARN